MIYDWAGRPLTEADSKQPISGQLVHWENVDRYQPQQTPGMSPESLTALLELANQGEPRYQALLAKEILEKDWDTIAHVGVRSAAVTGEAWCVRPPRGMENDATAIKIAEHAEEDLRGVNPSNRALLDTQGLLNHLMGGLLPGYMPAEIIWADGGAGFEGFNPILAEAVTFRFSETPKLWTYQQPLGIELAPNKFVVHVHRPLSGDATRGGLIRPLGWMFLMSMYGVKNLVRFVEKFGMPFVTARVDETDFDKSRAVLGSLIRNFGSNGGGVFTKAVELQLLEAVNSGGDVFFATAKYWGDAKKLVILGQLASSGESGGLSGGDAQSEVREDLRDHDVKQIERSMRQDLLRPWTMFNHGADAPVPEFHIESEEDEDLEGRSKVYVNLANAGWRVKQKNIEEQFGVEVEPVASAATQPASVMLTDAARSRVQNQHALRAANDVLVGRAVTAAARDRVMNPLLAPIIDAMDEAFAGLSLNDAADAKKGLARLREILGKNAAFDVMKSDALESLLSGVLFAADANARAARADDLAGRA